MEEKECTEEGVYFPGYRIWNEDFLKYALLHMKKLYVTLPENEMVDSVGQNESLIYIWKNSDLIENYRPSESAGTIASNKAIEELRWYIHVNRIRADEKKIYNGIEYQRGCRRERYRFWNYYSQNQRNCELAQHPFSKEFKNYCLGSRLAERRGDRVLISQGIMNIYYKELARAIAEVDKKSLVTDDVPAAIKLKELKPFLYSEEADRKVRLYKEESKCLQELTIEEAVNWRNKYSIN